MTDHKLFKCEVAAANGHDLRPEFEFADHAISGTRLDRQGLQAMLAGTAQGQFHHLYFESLSRLAREFVIRAPLLKQLVYVHHVRVISTSEWVDSDRAGWELMATFRSWMHTEFLKQSTRDLAVPDGRALRDRLSASSATLDQQEWAIQLWRQELLMQEVAAQLGCCRDTVTALIQDWHTACGLEVPDGQARRKELSRDKQSDSSTTQTERSNG